VVETQAVRKARLVEILATGGIYDPVTCFVGLYTAVTGHGENTVLADLTQATGAMATRQEVTTWTTPYLLADGSWVADSPTMEFRPADGTEAQTVQGLFIASLIAAGVLKAYWPFPAPVELLDHDHAVSVIIRVRVDPRGQSDANIVFGG
jgi:hypothetical protein